MSEAQKIPETEIPVSGTDTAFLKPNEGAWHLTIAQIRSAKNLTELIEAAYGTEGITTKDENGGDIVVSYEELKSKITNIKRHLAFIASSEPSALSISAEEAEDTLFGDLPEESGFRKRAMELYDEERLRVLSQLDIKPTVQKKEKAKNPKENTLETSIDKAVANHVELVTAYRSSLKEAYDYLHDEKNKPGFFSSIGKFFGKKTRIPKERMDELHVLRYQAALDLKNISTEIRGLVEAEGGTSFDVDQAMIKLRRNIRLQLQDLEKAGSTIETLTATGYEREVFVDGIKQYSQKELEELHSAYKASTEMEAMAGKFVPAGEVEKKEGENVSPEKTLAAAALLNNLKKEGDQLDKQAIELEKNTGAKVYEKVLAMGEWYSKLPRSHKIAIACSLAALTLTGFGVGAGSAVGVKIFSLAYAGRLARQGLFATSAAYAVDGYLETRGKRRKAAGKEEDIFTKRKELFSVGAGLATLIIPRIVSEKVGYLMQNTQIAEQVKDWFHSDVEPQVASIEIDEVPVEEKLPVTEIIPEENLPVEVVEEKEVPVVAPVLQKQEITINDKLGKRGDSIWGSLKHNGVSERAIANYENSHHKSINRLVRHGDKLTFTYDKETDTLKEVKVTKALKKAAKIAVTHTSEKTEVVNPVEPAAPAEKPVVTKEKIVSTKTAAITKEPPLPIADSKGEDFLNIIGQEDKSLKLYPDGGLPVENISLEVTNEVKNHFGSVGDKTWIKISEMKASSVFNKSNEEVAKILGGKKSSILDAQKCRSFITSLSNEAGIKPKRGETVLQFATRATEKISKFAQK